MRPNDQIPVHGILSCADGASEAVLRSSTTVHHDERMSSTLRNVDDDVLGVICAILDKHEVHGHLSLCSTC